MLTAPQRLCSDDARPEMVQFLPPGASRVVDVGCGSGSFGEHLKGEFPEVEVVGVESDREAAKRASSRLDEVLVGAFPNAMSCGTFDVVSFNDRLHRFLPLQYALTAVVGTKAQE